jgi:hypothetical protein
MIMSQSNRFHFQFSNPTAQKAEAALNLRETQKMLQKRVPAHLREDDSAELSAAGACFRNVSRILRGGK